MNLEWNHGAAEPPAETDCRDFPQRRDFASDGAVRAHLGTVLPGRALRDWEIANVWYFPGRSLEVVYRVRDETGAAVVTVRFQRPGESVAAFENARRRAARPEGVLHLRDWHAVAWIFPEDPSLRQIGAVISAKQAGAVLSRATGLPLAGSELDWSLLSYLPGRRCTVRLRWPAANADFVAKLGEGAEATQRRILALWHSPSRDFGMPQPLACDAAAELRWESFVAGERVDVFAEKQGIGRALGCIAPGLASLHAMKLPDLGDESAGRVFDRLCRKVIPRVCGALPAVEPATRAVAAELQRQQPGLPGRTQGTLHGDLHTANILARGTGTVLIDLDNLAQGDAAYDLAMLGTRLILGARLGAGSLQDAARMVETLPVAYRDAGGTAIPDALYAWYIALNLAGRQAKTCIRHHAPGMATLVPWLLAVASRTLAKRRFESSMLAD